MVVRQTKSERLFQLFCSQHGIEFISVPCEENRTPDFELKRHGQTVIAEVKELRNNPEEDALLQQLKEQKSIAGWADPRERIKNKISDAYPQLKNRACGILPTILVLFDNGTFAGIDGTDVKNAMYGSESWTISKHETHEVITPHLARDGKVQSRRNRQLSAVACLRGSEGNLHLHVFHNVYASNPLPIDFFQIDGCCQYTIDLKTKSLPEWDRLLN